MWEAVTSEGATAAAGLAVLPGLAPELVDGARVCVHAPPAAAAPDCAGGCRTPRAIAGQLRTVAHILCG
jgi:hypothetical protein